MSLADQLETYLTDLWGAPTTVTNLSRIPGGASRETYRLDAQIAGETGGATRGLILRRDPTGSLIDTDRRLEFLAYRTVHGPVPVPQAIALDEDGGGHVGAVVAAAACTALKPKNKRPHV